MPEAARTVPCAGRFCGNETVQLKLRTADGKMYLTGATNTEQTRASSTPSLSQDRYVQKYQKFLIFS
jgi:hypothetical protein